MFHWDSPTITEYSISIVLQLNPMFLVLKYAQNFIQTLNPSRCTDTHMHPLHASTFPFPPENILYMKPWYECMYEQAKTIEHISFTNAQGMTSSCACSVKSSDSVCCYTAFIKKFPFVLFSRVYSLPC